MTVIPLTVSLPNLTNNDLLERIDPSGSGGIVADYTKAKNMRYERESLPLPVSKVIVDTKQSVKSKKNSGFINDFHSSG